MSSPASYDTKERVRQAIDIVELVGELSAVAARRAKLQGPVPLARRHPPQLASQSRAAIVQVLGVRYRRRHFQLYDEDGKRRVPRSPGHAGRTGWHHTETARRSVLPATDDEKRPLYRAMAWAEEQFHQCLIECARGRTGTAVSGRSTRSRRTAFAAFTWALRPIAGIGCSSKRLSTEVSVQALETVGLIVRRQDGPGHYDRFRGRVLFPIRDVQGRPVAIGGRILPQLAADNAAKYVNSPETAAVFQEQHAVRARFGPRCHRSQTRVAVVMEGYTDTIVARQFGFENTVAVLGTALGERHIRLLATVCRQRSRWCSTAMKLASAARTKFWGCLWPSRSICELSPCPTISIRPIF